MLYKKNTAPSLTDELFANPTCEYRGTPFWAWNCKLEKDELCRQIEVFKEMGLGGFHMHVRTGLATPYLSDEYMDVIRACVDKAKNEKMLAWLYDEDRWPSGAAGGFVTKEEQYRARYLLFTPVSYEEKAEAEKLNGALAQGGRNGGGNLLACYDVVLDSDGYLADYRRIEENEKAEGSKWYAYLEIHSPSEWYNNQTYVDTLNKKAIERFVEVTHEAYRKKISDEFGETVPAIFTDEPQFTRKKLLGNSFDKKDVVIPWTDDIPETYAAQYSADVFDTLPELFWDKKNEISRARYLYHDHISERFASAFADTCGDWCRKNGIALTGHMMEEPTLRSQTAALGDCMRSYRGFDLPGIDMLCHGYEFTTAKQAQSAVHQYGREGMLSELYGVTGWDYDFRGHKLQGDWQAALGVTVRVPHLSWLSMEGEAKRDYPASISYQSPWYSQYSYVENHFARVNTAMTRGKPVVKVAVVHPVESYWLHWGPNDKTALKRESMDRNFSDITQWLIKGSIDFDFICEALLPSMCEEGSAPLCVGKMKYDAVIVPACETLRSTTYDRLEKFRKDGGKLIFMGDAPAYEDAVPSERGKALASASICVSYDRAAILSALEDNRTLTVRNSNGELTDNLIYQMRKDSDCTWVFIAHCKDPGNKNVSSGVDTRITVKGEFVPYIYDTVNGGKYEAEHTYVNGNTVIPYRFYAHDSLLLRLADGMKEYEAVCGDKKSYTKNIRLPKFVDYSLSEKNVLLLDMCEFNVDGGEWQPEEEILRADNTARSMIGLCARHGHVVQPWVIENKAPEHTIGLKFTVNSRIEADNTLFAVENCETAVIKVNGEEISNKAVGWFVDKAIDTVIVPHLNMGENVIEVTLPLGERTNTEWCYLLGNFGVNVCGTYKELVPMPAKVSFSDLTRQLFPFYGGNITYHTEIETVNGGFEMSIPQYAGAMIKVSVDGEDRGNIVYDPYLLRVDGLEDGVHKVDIKLFIHRYNCFGPVHLANELHSWNGPDSWRSKNDSWSYEYILRRTGIYTAPHISV